jgi:hypothetical protein
MRLGFSIWLALDFANAGTVLSKGHGDGSDFGAHSSSEDNAASASLGNRRRAVCDVEAVARAGVLVKDGIAILSYRERFTGKKSLVGLEVQGFNNTASGISGMLPSRMR